VAREITMIDRVALAIAAALHDSDWKGYRTAALAAILALREPTSAMLDAATSGLPDWGNLPENWRAMIDRAAGING
jgi:hypothetical protein